MSRFLSEFCSGECIETGYVGKTEYITPLHQTSIVPGHIIVPVGVCVTLGPQSWDRQCIYNVSWVP